MNKGIKDWKEVDNKKARVYLDTRVICKCGRRLPIPVYKDEVTCKWCGRIVKNTSRQYFKLKMMDMLVKQQIEEDVKNREGR